MTQQFATSTVTEPRVDGLPTTSEVDSMDIGLLAKGVCSGVFVCQRSVEDILQHSIAPVTTSGKAISVHVNRDRGIVTAMTPDGMSRAARFLGDQGAVLLPLGSAKVFFEPEEIIPAPVEPTVEHWEGPGADPGDGWNAAGLEKAAETAFSSSPDTYTAAFLVAHRGKLIVERYRDGVDRHTQLPSWSMGKTLTAALIGCLIQQGILDLDEPAPIDEWQGDNDPRRNIRVSDLLRMSSGLDFSATWAPDYTPDHGYPDHSYIYGGAVDAFQLALSRPLAHEPNTLGAYKNGDTLALGAIIKRKVRLLGERYFSWPQKALFDPLGINRLVLEPDPYGNFLTSGFNYGSARSWCRLGQLFLNDGVWQGKRLLPRGFVDFVRSPAPAWRGRYWTEEGPPGWTDSIYGGQVWLNRYPETDRWPLPFDAYFMLGIGGQYTFVIPSMELVIVRMGYVRGVTDNNSGREPLATALDQLMQAREVAG